MNLIRRIIETGEVGWDWIVIIMFYSVRSEKERQDRNWNPLLVRSSDEIFSEGRNLPFADH